MFAAITAIDRFDPVCRGWVSPAYSCFLKAASALATLIIQLLIVSKSKPESASSGPSSLSGPPLCVYMCVCGGELTYYPLLLQTQASLPTCDHFLEGHDLRGAGEGL